MSFTVTLDDRKFRKLIKKLEVSQRKGVNVGILQSKGASAPQGKASMVEIAASHEFGAPKAGIPERSFIRSTFITREADAKKMLARLVTGIVDDKIEVENGLRLLGAWAVAAVKNTITSGDIPPPLKAATIAKKKSSKPLVDTGQLINSIHFEVS